MLIFFSFVVRQAHARTLCKLCRDFFFIISKNVFIIILIIIIIIMKIIISSITNTSIVVPHHRYMYFRIRILLTKCLFVESRHWTPVALTPPQRWLGQVSRILDILSRNHTCLRIHFLSLEVDVHDSCSGFALFAFTLVCLGDALFFLRCCLISFWQCFNIYGTFPVLEQGV